MGKYADTYLQVGEDATATKNFTLSVPDTPDGTIALKRGNKGAESATIFSVDATGKIITTASATASAGINIPHGTAPTSPANGDMWTTTSGLYIRINGSTVGPLT
jgi:hypothetical protein